MRFATASTTPPRVLLAAVSLAGAHIDVYVDAVGDLLATGMEEKVNLCPCAQMTDGSRGGRAAMKRWPAMLLMLATNNLGPSWAPGLLDCGTGVAATSARSASRAARHQRGTRGPRRPTNCCSSGRCGPDDSLR